MGPRTAFLLAALAASSLTSLACTRQESSGPSPPAIAAAVPAVPKLVAVPSTSNVAPPSSVAPEPSPGGEGQPAVASHVRLVGRFVPEPDGMRFAWSGSGLVARFEGTALRVRVRDEGMHALNAFQVVVDGEPRGVLGMQKGREVYTAAADLAPGVHEVALYKRTEAKVGEMLLLGVEVDGRLLPPPPAPERRVEIIGDSISTGYGNEGPGPVCTFDPRQQNEYLTYGAIASRALRADHLTVAWSGKTLYQMREYFSRALPAREGSTWDFSRTEPQLVVVNVGTNNFALVDPGEKRFVELYLALIAKVRAAYPSAFIVCALGPMLTDVYPDTRKNLTLARRYMKTAVARLKESGDRNLDMLEFPEQKHTDGLGCGFHPSLKTHKLMADRLTAFARERLGW